LTKKRVLFTDVNLKKREKGWNQFNFMVDLKAFNLAK
jgi:hypothetical protein